MKTHWQTFTLAVAVLAGSFVRSPMSSAADKKLARTPVRQAAATFGIVTAKTDKDITIKAEGEKEAKRYLLAPEGGKPTADLAAAMKMVFPTNLVAFRSQGEKDPVLAGIQAMHSRTRLGTATGTVVAVDPAASMPTFDVKPSGPGYTERYVPRWDPAAKSCDKNLVAIIAGLNEGDKVKIAWSYDERKRAVQIQVVSRAKKAPAKSGAKPPAKTPQPEE